MTTSLRIGIFGAGVVGGGVIDLAQKLNSSGRLKMVGASITIVKACVKNINKAREFKSNPATLFVDNYADILHDDSINCIVEVMGGITDARDVVFEAIRRGKHVVTANKALVAAYMTEIEHLLAAHPTVQFLFEAAVCGGIPIIHTLQSAFLGDRVTSISGIMNGTTNYMLSKMEDEAADYSDVLADAQRLGYAEADPTADVEGLDVQAKIALLVKLAYGKTVPIASVPTVGISRISSSDFACAKTMSSTIKLLGTASLNADGSLAVYVSPALVPQSNPLSTAKGPGNMVVIHSQNMGASTLSGPGAGRYPTANSILSDLIRLSQGVAGGPFPLSAEEIVLNSDFMARFYVRIKVARDCIGILRFVGEAAQQNEISVRSFTQCPVSENAAPTESADFVVLTEVTTHSKVQAFAVSVANMSAAVGAAVVMPIL